MEPKGFHRKLTAILSADVAGYSRLMQEDESATVKTLESYKQAFFDLIKQHRGRVVDSPGDNLLAEFASVVDAVQCAVAVQKELQARNTELPENRKMQFRIGVNLGDVIEEESRIYGDGVNIAGRLESLADPGGICVSKTAFDQIETKLPFGYEFLGEQTVKNIAKPVGAYRVVLEPRVTKKKGAGFKQGAIRKMALIALAVALVAVSGVALWQYFIQPVTPTVEKADPKQMALPLPELPSIAVLPFVNLSEDPKQQLLCDGITDNIINALSKVPQLFVIARNSTFTYKGKTVKAKQVSEELGVRYVLEGSVQRSDDRVRITAQLVDALTGNQLLAERYDSESTDLFALQDNLTFKVLEAVRLKLTDNVRTGQGKYFSGKLGLDCYMKALEAVGLQQQLNIADNNRSRQIVEECLAMCPEAPTFYRLLGGASLNDYFIGSSKSPQESIEKAKELFQKAISMDEKDFYANAILSHIYTIKKKNDKAISQAERAVEIAPGSSWAIQWNATALTYAGRYEEAIPLFEKAIRLNPSAPTMFYLHFGHALRETGRLEEAAMSFKRAIERAPKYVWPHAALAAVYTMMGRNNEAHAAAVEVLRLHPKFSLEWVAKTSLYKDPAVIERVVAAMRKAGLPDKPPAVQP